MTHQDYPGIPGKKNSIHPVEENTKSNENKADDTAKDSVVNPAEPAKDVHAKKEIAEHLLYHIQKDTPQRQFKPDDDDDSILTDKPNYGKHDDDDEF